MRRHGSVVGDCGRLEGHAISPPYDVHGNQHVVEDSLRRYRGKQAATHGVYRTGHSYGGINTTLVATDELFVTPVETDTFAADRRGCIGNQHKLAAHRANRR